MLESQPKREENIENTRELREQETDRNPTLIDDMIRDVLFQIGVEPDDCFRFQWVNEIFLSTTGLTEQQVVGRRIEEVIPEPSLAFVRNKYREAIQEEKTVRWEETSEYPAGVKVGDVTVTPVFDDEGICTHLIGSVHDITERKRAEEKLKQNEKKYRSLFENMLNGYAYCKIIVDDDGKPVDFVYLEVNDSFERLTGLKREDVIDRKVTEAIPGIKESHPELFDIYGKVALTGQEERFEINFKPLDMWLSISVYCPQEGYFVAVFEDISDRKKAQEAERKEAREELEHAHMLLKAIVESPKGVIIMAVDKEYRYLFLNETHEQVMKDIYGVSIAVEMDLLDCITTNDDRAKAKTNIDRALSGKSFTTIQEFGDINRAYYETVYSPIVDASGEISGATIFATDITKRRKMEDENSKLLRAIETASEAMFLTSPDAIIEYTNNSMRGLFGYQEGELIGKHVAILNADPTSQETVDQITNGLEENGWWEGEIRNRRKDGAEFWSYATISVYRDKKGQTLNFVSTQHDITDRKRMADELLESHNLLEQRVEERTAELKASNERLLAEVDERKRLTEALLEREKKLLKAQQVAGMGFLDWNLKTNDMYWSEEIYRIYGVKPPKKDSELLDITVKLAHPDDQECVQKNLDMAIKGIKRYDIDHRMLLPDGKVIWVHAQADLVRDQDGNPESLMGTIVDITERKQAEDELRKSEEHYRMLAETMNDGLGRIDENGRFLYVNKKHGEILGCSPDEMVGKHWTEFFDRDAQKTIELRVNAGRNGLVEPYEVATTRKDGRKIHIRVSPQPIFDENNKFRGSLALLTDITEHKQAEEARRESEERFHTSVENMLDCFGIYSAIRDKSGRIVDFRIEYVNKAACVSNRMTKEEQIGRRLLELLPAHRETGLFDDYCQTVETGEPIARESLIYGDAYRKEHLIRAFDIRAVKLGDGFTATWRDVTEDKQAEEMLRHSEARFRSLSEAVFEGIAVAENGVIVDANEELAKMFGYSLEELKGKQIIELISPEHRELVAENIRSGYEGIYEPKGLHKDGSLIDLEVHGRSVMYQGRKMRLTAVRDITGRKKAQEALQQREERLELFFSQSLDGFFFMMLDEPVRWDDAVDKEKTLDYVFAHQRMTKVNDAVLQQYGASREQFMGLTPNDFYAHDIAYGRKVWRDFFDGGRLHVETDERKFDGTPTWIEGDYICLYDSKGRITGHFGIQHDVTERKLAQEKVLSYQEQLRSLAYELSLTEERERRRIAMDLHDGIGQTLALSKINLQSLGKSAGLAENPQFNEILQSIESTIDQVQTSTFDLSSPTLYKFGLGRAIEELLHDYFQKSDTTTYEFGDDTPSEPVAEELRVLLFQSVRELLINMIKHAQAHKVTVVVQRDDDNIRITVSDDGVGFDIEQIEPFGRRTGGFGLFNIRERLNYIGGSFLIQSKQSEGSRFTLTVPLKGKTLIHGGFQ